MNWFIVALGAPFVWSLVNYCDKIILSRYFKGGGSGALMIFVGVIALPLSIILGVSNPQLFSVSLPDILVLIGSGLLYNVGVLLYLKALETDDVSRVVPFWQLVPVFAYFLGIFILGEQLVSAKLFGGLIVILGTVLLSIKLSGAEKFTFHKKTSLIMVTSSFVLALGYVIFKDGDGGDFWVSMFWNQIGMLVFGAICALVPSYRNEFIDVIKQNSAGVLGLNIVEQIVEIVGIFINNFALLLAPAALVMLVEYTAQPLFVFIEGVLFTLLFPTLVQEDISKSNLIQKFFAIVIMSVGLYFITN